MSDGVERINTIHDTRKKTADILRRSIEALDGKSEKEVANDVLKNMADDRTLYLQGWYDPPPGGVSILFDDTPFTHLQYESIRDKAFWPSEQHRFDNETVGFVYASPIDRATGLFGDHGFTVYRGDDSAIRQHVRTVYEAIYDVAESSEVGMKFADLYARAMRIFAERGKGIKWMSTINDMHSTNLGHTVPGSYEGSTLPTGAFEDIKYATTKGRVFINETASFAIPATCAFTVEARLADVHDVALPNTFFHFIVAFSDGRKEIYSDFDAIFRDVGMDYML